MAPITGTQNVRVVSSEIWTRGVRRNIVRSSSDDLFLVMHLYVDPTVMAKASVFGAAFQLQEVQTNQVFTHFWGALVQPTTAIAQLAPSFWLSLSWPQASLAGVVRNAFPVFKNSNGFGLYIFRPSFILGIRTLPVGPGWFTSFDGVSEFSIGDEQYLLLEV